MATITQKDYAITLTGVSDLILHRDNITHGERVKRWSKDPANKASSVAGDDRTPAWGWMGCLYHDDKVLTIDSDNIMSMLRDAGKKVPAAKGKGSMKAQTQSGILCNEIGWPIIPFGSDDPIALSDVMVLDKELDFATHEATAEALGFSLFVKRAKVGSSKHVRVRPRFAAGWRASGTITVTDPAIDAQMLDVILSFGGRLIGIGDWRPGAPSPGRFGTFLAEIRAI